MPLVAFDSNMAIWCTKPTYNPLQVLERQKAKDLMALLTKHGYDIVLPTPVVAELLSDINDPAIRQNTYEKIRATFQIADFDSKAALHLAEILNYHYNTTNKAYKNLGIEKTKLKYDALIVGIAKSSGAECLFSHDPDCKTIAGGFYQIKGLNEMPDSIPQNIGMFDNPNDHPF